MLKITPSTLSGNLTPVSLDKSLFSALALASLSNTDVEIRYKGLSDEVMCAVNALERLGALISISKDKMTLTHVHDFPESVNLDFSESSRAFFMLLPLIKKYISTVKVTHSVISNFLSKFCSVLEECGCEVKEGGMTLHVNGKFTNTPTTKVDHPDISDGLALCGIGEPSESVKNAIDFFKRSDNSLFTADANPLYLSCFVMASSFIECEYDIPDTLKPFATTSVTNGIYRHSPRLEPFVADATLLGDYFLPCVLLALRVGKPCTFQSYRMQKGFHTRLIQMLSDLNVKHKLSKDTLTVNAESGVCCERIRAWQDEQFIITACLASTHSDKETILDSERAVIRKYPTFFDDFKSLGGIYQKL